MGDAKTRLPAYDETKAAQAQLDDRAACSARLAARCYSAAAAAVTAALRTCLMLWHWLGSRSAAWQADGEEHWSRGRLEQQREKEEILFGLA